MQSLTVFIIHFNTNCEHIYIGVYAISRRTLNEISD